MSNNKEKLNLSIDEDIKKILIILKHKLLNYS